MDVNQIRPPGSEDTSDRYNFTSRKTRQLDSLPTLPQGESCSDWIAAYLNLAIQGVRSAEVSRKIALHLDRFQQFFVTAYGHDRLSHCLKRDVLAWQRVLQDQGLAVATINNHLASLAGFATWVHAQASHLFPAGNPTKGIGELALPPLEPRRLTDEQVRSLKNICDRLERFHRYTGRRRQGDAGVRQQSRPWRDRAIVFVLLSTGLRREELVCLDLAQSSPTRRRH
jgi:site-specific recombinase XerD